MKSTTFTTKRATFRFGHCAGMVLAAASVCGWTECGGQTIAVGYDADGGTQSDSGSSSAATTSGTTAADDSGSPPTNVRGPNGPTSTMPGGGTGPTLGDCPAAEPAAGSACLIPGRLCMWTRNCGAGGVVGWCTAAKSWDIVEPLCQAGCPAWPPGQSLGSQFGPPPDAMCTAGLDCRYHSNPIQGGTIQHCQAGGSGTIWTGPDSWNDGWVPAPAGRGSNACGELAACSGESGCGGSCPDPAPKTCYCGPDGHMYCEIGPACGGGIVSSVRPIGASCTQASDCQSGKCAASTDGGLTCQ
jgi:hypothetical protein